nr:PREDICTED: E3 ubiquitin-protein ligase TRIM39-like [Struthio camelus australis]
MQQMIEYRLAEKGDVTLDPQTAHLNLVLSENLKSLSVKSKQVGVFLDDETGKVSFYNMTIYSHIYMFDVIFDEPLCPLFYPGICVSQLDS